MAVAFRLHEPVTEAVLLALSRANPQYRFETTAAGELVVSPLTGTEFSFAEGELFAQVQAWNKQRRLGRVTPASGGITLSDGAIKGPDIAFISNERWATLGEDDRNRAFVRVAPTVVFELLSPNDDPALREKIREYLRTGTPVAVLLDPRDRSVRIFRSLGAQPEILFNPTAAPICEEMPGFTLDAKAVFDACEAP